MISLTHFSLGVSAQKFFCNRFGATGHWWLLLVVALNFLEAFARQPCSHIILATRCFPTRSPSLFKRLVIRGAPASERSSSKIAFIFLLNHDFVPCDSMAFDQPRHNSHWLTRPAGDTLIWLKTESIRPWSLRTSLRFLGEVRRGRFNRSLQHLICYS